MGRWRVFCTLVVFHVAALRPLDCDGVEEDGVRWDVVRSDLCHALGEVLHNGALTRDLHAAKDSKGRDPAVSYGDVQLQRHLERFQKLVLVLPEKSRCPLGRHSLRILVSVLYSGLSWDIWFQRYEEDLWSLVHGTNWTEALAAGWPIFEVLSLVAELYQGVALPEECQHVDSDLSSLMPLIGSADPSELIHQRTHTTPLLRSCPLARSSANAALAAAGMRANGGRLQMGLASGVDVGLLAQTQTAARLAAGRHGAGPKALFAQPLPSLLLRLASAHQKFHRAWMRRGRVDIIYCGQLEIEEELGELCKGVEGECLIHFLRQNHTEKRSAECFQHYRFAGRSVADAARRSPGTSGAWSTLLVSPNTWTWTEELAEDLRSLLFERHKFARDVAVAGLPAMNRSRIFNWPVRRVIHRYWKLAYEEYATGHETSPFLPLAQFWAVGDTTSGSRVYGTRTFASLLARLEKQEMEYVPVLPAFVERGGAATRGNIEAILASENEGPEDWLVMLDLLGKDAGVRAYTFLNGASLEDSYQAAARLSPRLSQTFHIEAAHFLPPRQLDRGPAQNHCLFPEISMASTFTHKYGVVVSWCSRNFLRKMFQDVGRWWLGLDPLQHIIVPVSASVLNLYRSGETELFPWDADIDANFIASHPIVIGSFLEQHEEKLRRMGYTYILRGDRVVFRTLEDTARMDIWLSGPQDVRGYDIRARLCGLRVNFFRDQLKGSVWYYRPGEKIYGNTRGQLLHCQWKGHNACLPDCVRNGLGVGKDGCEFPDRFGIMAQGQAESELPENFTIDKDAKYTGTVLDYNKWRGFGHISIDQKGVVPEDKLFVHWKNIQTDDRFPRLKEGLQVEFGLMMAVKRQGYNKSTSVKAKTVTLPGGGMINIQDEMDAEMLTFVGAQNLRYTGTIKFFDQIRGFGWVIIDDGFSMEEPVPKEIKVQGSELHTGGKPLRMRLDKLAVEFGIIKNRKGDGYLAYNLTLPGGTPITQETLENRQPEGGQRYTGTVQWWHRWQGWGHIAPENTSAFPAPVQQKLAEAAAQAAAKAKEGESKSEEKLLYFRKADCEWSLRPEVGKKVTFAVYTDDKGAGATEVLAAD
eukprot:symbB.v1.2.031502.t1/scaffold3665.1/size69420/3